MTTLNQQAPGRVALTGKLERDQVAGVWQQRAKLWQAADKQQLTLDLQSVSQADTAGLALLLTLFQEAKTHGVTLNVINLPAQLRSAAQFSRLDHILSWSSPVQA